MSSGITHMDRNKLQKKSRSLMLGTENYDNTCLRIHIYKHRKHGKLHVSKKKKAYQCTSISLQRHAVKVSNLLDGFKRLLVQHSFRKRNVSHQFHLHTRFFIIKNHAFGVTCAIYKITHARAPLHVSGDQICISLTCLVN